MDERSDEELVADCVAGDERAFSILVERHIKTVYSFVARFVGNAQDAEDIVQETFLKAWRSISRYRAEASRFKTWVMRIARNTSIDHMRKRKNIAFSEFDTADGHNVLAETLPDDNDLPDELFARQQDVQFLQKAVETLPPEAREILLLHYTGGLTFLEIGEMLGQPQNTVKSRHHRAIQTLKKRLREVAPDGTKA
jgi:RNA polymerase sigma-70 factor (ECF subfamily)